MTAANAKEQLKTQLKNAISSAISGGELPQAELTDFIFDVPADRSHGDLASNIAMASARVFKKSPLQIANIIVSHLKLEGGLFDRCQVAGPGFINFFYSSSFYGQVLAEVQEQGEGYGKSDFGKNEKLLVEFVSANPTGPMHIGNARGGALGDCLASVLDAAGFAVSREFYINDAGNQLDKFAMSLDIRYCQLFMGDAAPELPEDSYHGEDITEHAKAYANLHGDALMKQSEEERRKALTDFALPKNIEKMKADLARYGVHFDRWFKESELYKSGEVDRLVALFKEKGITYEQDGALWYKATDFGADKDEVLIRSNGRPTYFLVDIAYHKNKFDRGFSQLIDCWGADHHGHVARMKTALSAIGEDGGKLHIVLYQLVNLVRDGETVRMSKRTGKAIQLGDLLDEVSRDAARFTFNMHEPNIAMDFDLGLAVKEDAQNPVYYVQYAHARICSIIRTLEADGIDCNHNCSQDQLALLQAPEEIDLIRYISIYPEEIVRSAKNYDPSVITKYTVNLATLFHKFYNSCRVKGKELPLMQARIQLCRATQTVLKNALNMFSISVPDRM